MRYAEIDKGRVRFVLSPELADEYTILPPNSIEISLDADVREGQVFQDGEFSDPPEPDPNAELTIEQKATLYDEMNNAITNLMTNINNLMSNMKSPLR